MTAPSIITRGIAAHFSSAALVAVLFAAGCSGKDADPFAPGTDAGGGRAGATGDASASGSGGAAQDGSVSTGGAGGVTPTGSGGSPGSGGIAGGGTGGQGGAPSGRPRPARMVVLGDSITACSNVGGAMGADCAIKKLYDYVKATYAPNLVYQNQAVARAVSTDVPAEQLSAVPSGPGHALVVVYVGGNDLSKYIFTTDTAATNGLDSDMPKILMAWDQIFANFADKTKFPDGFTMVMNTQYNPFDNCTALPYNLSAKKNELLNTFNTSLKDVAQKKGAIITDQYTPFLGHGHHYRVMSCPHFTAGAAGWMDDLIHPNAAGHANLYEQWKKVVDTLYR